MTNSSRVERSGSAGQSPRDVSTPPACSVETHRPTAESISPFLDAFHRVPGLGWGFFPVHLFFRRVVPSVMALWVGFGTLAPPAALGASIGARLKETPEAVRTDYRGNAPMPFTGRMERWMQAPKIPKSISPRRALQPGLHLNQPSGSDGTLPRPDSPNHAGLLLAAREKVDSVRSGPAADIRGWATAIAHFDQVYAAVEKAGPEPSDEGAESKMMYQRARLLANLSTVADQLERLDRSAERLGDRIAHAEVGALQHRLQDSIVTLTEPFQEFSSPEDLHRHLPPLIRDWPGGEAADAIRKIQARIHRDWSVLAMAFVTGSLMFGGLVKFAFDPTAGWPIRS
jgi:hypothetical protein